MQRFDINGGEGGVGRKRRMAPRLPIIQHWRLSVPIRNAWVCMGSSCDISSLIRKWLSDSNFPCSLFFSLLQIMCSGAFWCLKSWARDLLELIFFVFDFPKGKANSHVLYNYMFSIYFTISRSLQHWHVFYGNALDGAIQKPDLRLPDSLFRPALS